MAARDARMSEFWTKKTAYKRKYVVISAHWPWRGHARRTYDGCMLRFLLMIGAAIVAFFVVLTIVHVVLSWLFTLVAILVVLAVVVGLFRIGRRSARAARSARR
jgi:ABC-type multidrug transport system fused ATPase/permease subunit